MGYCERGIIRTGGRIRYTKDVRLLDPHKTTVSKDGLSLTPVDDDLIIETKDRGGLEVFTMPITHESFRGACESVGREIHQRIIPQLKAAVL